MRTPHPASTRARSGAILLVAPLLLGALAAACSQTVAVEEGASPDAKNYCAIVGACGLKPSFGFGECINEIARNQITLASTVGTTADQERYDCVKAAGTNCDKAKLCIGRVATDDQRCTDPAQGDPYPGQQTRSFCDGDRITVCESLGAGSQSFTCGDDFALQHFGGPKCVEDAPASALCGFKACGDDAGTPVPPTCAGNILAYCVNGVEQHTDCAALGGTCDATTGKCGGTCESTGFACSGTTLVKTCAAGDKLALYDCADRPGWTCRVPTDMTTFGCLPPYQECEWGVYQASCVEGTKVRFCDDGKIKIFDCKDAGAATCVSSMVGVNCAL
jgi:hypothetical protein